MTERALALSAALALAGEASAQTPSAPSQQTSTLNWVRLRGSESCISSTELARAVETRLGRTVFVAASQGVLAIEGRVQPLRHRVWSVTIVATGPDGKVVGTKTLHSEKSSCRELDDDVVLVVALIIDPDAASRPPPPTPPSPAPPPPRVVVRQERVVVHETEHWGVDLALAATLNAGLLPRVAPGAEASVALRPWQQWSIEVGGEVLAAVGTDDDAGRGGRFWALQGEALGCRGLGDDVRIRFGICAGAAFGAIESRGVGLTQTGSAGAFLATALARGRLETPIYGPLSARLGLGVGVPLARPSFVYNDFDAGALATVTRSVHTVAPVTFDASLGGVVRF